MYVWRWVGDLRAILWPVLRHIQLLHINLSDQSCLAHFPWLARYLEPASLNRDLRARERTVRHADF